MAKKKQANKNTTVTPKSDATRTVQTPCSYFNMISGGLRFSTLVECWGANQTGKSTFCYQTVSNFLKEYPDGEFKLLTPEGKVDETRMKYAFGIPLDRIDLIAAQTLEDGFFEIGERLNTKKPTIILWDTISAAPTKASFESQQKATVAPTDDGADKNKMGMFAGGRTERPRVIKHYLRNLLSMMYEQPVIIMLPNQVFSSMDMYNPGEQSGEGSALKHDLHYSFHFKTKNSEITYDAKTGLADYTISEVELTKSKYCPKFEWKPIYIDNANGGIIDPLKSIALTAFRLGIIFKVKDPAPGAGNSNTFAVGEEPPKDTKKENIDYSKITVLGRDWEKVQSDAVLMAKVEREIMKRILQKNFIIKMVYMEEYGKADYVKELLAEAEADAAKQEQESPEPSTDEVEETDQNAAVGNLIQEAQGPRY